MQEMWKVSDHVGNMAEKSQLTCTTLKTMAKKIVREREREFELNEFSVKVRVVVGVWV